MKYRYMQQLTHKWGIDTTINKYVELGWEYVKFAVYADNEVIILFRHPSA